ncbi:MAG: hypothetical protein KAJ03_01150 [Gammaproteobacteria bacterium]|nr:hypothetical protein [Gammaproteobacteria bacterium]
MINYASSEEEYNSMCEAEAAHDADMADQDAQAQAETQDEYEQNMSITRQMNPTSVRMDALSAITKERAGMVSDIDNHIAFLQDSIKRDCIDAGKTIKTDTGTVTYIKGSKRTSWNSKMLAGLELVYPEISECKKITETAPNAAIKLDG